MFNFVDVVGTLIQGGLLDKISRFLGVSPETTERILEAVVPTSMYSIANLGSTELRARKLIEILDSRSAPQIGIQDMARWFDDPNVSPGLMASSESFLERLFGGQRGGIVDKIAALAGADRGAVSKTFALVTPILMSMLGKQVTDRNLDAAELARFLGEQKALIAQHMPHGIRSLLELPSSSSERGPATVRQERRPLPMLIAGVLAVALFGWFVSRFSRKPEYPTAMPTAMKTAPVETVVVETPPVNMVEPAEVVVAQEPELSSGSSAVEELAAFFDTAGSNAKRIVFEGLTFESGKAALTEHGSRIADDLAALFNANPSARVKIEGFTDSTGEAALNKKLSEARAEELKARLIEKGVSEGRIESTGLGEEQPIATNRTEEGRAQNRRVEVEVEKGT